MNLINLFNKIENEFDKPTAIVATIAMGLNLSMDITDEDFTNKNLYSTRLMEKINNVLWEHEEQIKMAMEIIDACYEYHQAKNYGEEKCLKECIKNLYT